MHLLMVEHEDERDGIVVEELDGCSGILPFDLECEIDRSFI